jgi:hypothetical protein
MVQNLGYFGGALREVSKYFPKQSYGDFALCSSTVVVISDALD